MTLEQALGRPIETLLDYVRARCMFDYVKHGSEEDPRFLAEERINALTPLELIELISDFYSDNFNS